MHEDTDELARLIRSHGLKVKLDSNGTYPERLEGLLSSGLLDYVAMDLKTAPGLYWRLLSGTSPGRTRTELRIGRTGHDDLLASTHTGDLLRAGEELGERIRRSVEVLRRWSVPYELRTTVAPGIVATGEMEEIVTLLPGARRYVLKAFRGGTTLDPEWSNAESPSDELMNRLCELAAASGVPCEIS